MRWINVTAGHSISWSIQPHKKSINFGVFKHPGAGASTGLTPALPSASTFGTTQTNDADVVGAQRQTSNSDLRVEGAPVVEKLKAIGLRCVEWVGKCEGDKVSTGNYSVVEGEGGMYAMVFDVSTPPLYPS